MNSATESKECVIHMTRSDDDDHLVSPQNYTSWLTLLEAAKVRNHEHIINVAEGLEGNEVPEIFYHRKCRSLFTMKRDLNILKRKANEDTESEAGGSSAPKRPCRISVEKRVYDTECIFCRRDKYVKGSKTREQLSQVVQLRADERLRECAIKKNDKDMIALTSRDIVAAEARYHFSCYRNYNRECIQPEVEGADKPDDTDEFAQYQRIEKEAYAKLLTYIRTDVIPNKTIIPDLFTINNHSF